MSTAWITDISTVTALGDGLEELWEGLLAGRGAIRPVRRFEVDAYSSGIAAMIEGLDHEGPGFLVQELLERLFEGFGPVPRRCRLITATTKGDIEALERWRRGLSDDTGRFQIPRLLQSVAGILGIDDEGINISAACASSAAATAWGAELIASGETDAVVICSMDVVSEFVFSGFAALKALSATPCRPFDRDRSGLSLGEGAVAMLLMSPEAARSEKRVKLGTVLGGAVANDANHITAPARDGSGLILAVRQALRRAGKVPSDVVAVSAHGTGTVYNDLMELTAFDEVFGDVVIPVYSVKGSIGHTLGAAGGIEVAIALKALAEQTVPPTVGLANPAGEACGRVSSSSVDISGDCLLSTNSGFGGVNAAVVIGRGGDR